MESLTSGTSITSVTRFRQRCEYAVVMQPGRLGGTSVLSLTVCGRVSEVGGRCVDELREPSPCVKSRDADRLPQHKLPTVYTQLLASSLSHHPCWRFRCCRRLDVLVSAAGRLAATHTPSSQTRVFFSSSIMKRQCSTLAHNWTASGQRIPVGDVRAAVGSRSPRCLRMSD